MIYTHVILVPDSDGYVITIKKVNVLQKTSKIFNHKQTGSQVSSLFSEPRLLSINSSCTATFLKIRLSSQKILAVTHCTKACTGEQQKFLSSTFILSQVLMCSCNQGGKEKNFSALSTEGKKWKQTLLK